MKKYLLSFLMLISFISFAQDPELGDNTWYLQNVIINGASNFTPVNNEVTDISLEFFVSGYDFSTTVCNSLFADLSFDETNSSFTPSTMSQTLIVCNILENNAYENLYFGFYFDNQSSPFTYSITTNSSTSTLIVTASNGDQAIYGNARLNVNQVKLADIKTYPNPVVDELVINQQKLVDDIQVRAFGIHGQLVFSKVLSQTQTIINTSDLKLGVYFVVLETDNQRKDIRKIIKQ